MSIISEVDALEVVKENYIEFSKYTVDQRTYASIYDGCKAVHRRCLYTAFKSTPRHKVKLTNHIGAAIIYHPHSPDSIGGTIISMASKYSSPFPLYDTQGNYGDRENRPSAARYLEAALSDTAISIFMPFVDYADMGTPEYMEEPLALPTLLPLAFLQGVSGIGVGTPNPNVPSFNPIDLINYYVEALNSEDFTVRDNFMVKPNVGNTYVASTRKQWLDMMRTGQGTIKYQPDIEVQGNKIIITKVPEGRNIENLMKKLSLEISQDKIDVRDESDIEIKYVIEKVPRKSVDMKNIEAKAMNALTISESYKFIFSDSGRASICSFNDVVRKNLEYTVWCCSRKLDDDINKLSRQVRILSIIENMKRDGLVSKISSMSLDEAVDMIAKKYSEDRELVLSAFQKRSISYLTREHKQEIDDLNARMQELLKYRENPRDYLRMLYKDLVPKVKSVISNKVMTEFKKSK